MAIASEAKWEKWLDGKSHYLRRGVDYRCKTKSLIREAMMRAGEMEMTVGTHETDIGVSIELMPRSKPAGGLIPPYDWPRVAEDHEPQPLSCNPTRTT